MRERLAGVLHRAGALTAIMHVRRLAPVPPRVAILTYHHIAEDDPAYPYDRGVADATPAQFRRQLETLARFCTPIGIDELVGAFEGQPLPKNPVMVTFDDGYRSCHDTALPILREVGMRATFFIATSYVNERKLYWWERIALVLSQTRREKATITYPKTLEVERTAHRTLTDLIKDTPGLEIGKFLGELARAFDVEWNAQIEARHADHVVMTWDHVRALARAGMDVESHTRTHRVLQTLSDDDLRSELAGSKQELEAQLGRPVRAIAYPVGRRIAHIDRIRDAVAAAGYQLGLTNASGATRVWPGPLARMMPSDRFDVSRLSTDRDMSDAMWFTQVAVPRLAYIGRHDG